MAAKNPKLPAFMLKTMECSRAYNIHCVNSMSLLKYHNIKLPKVDKNNWAKTMENILLYLKLVRGVRRVLLANVVPVHVKVSHFLNESDKYLNFDMEMNVRSHMLSKK